MEVRAAFATDIQHDGLAFGIKHKIYMATRIMVTRILTLLFLAATATLYAQGEFNPDQRLMELAGKKENIGICAAYSKDGDVKWSQSAGLACQESEIPFSSTIFFNNR